MSAVSEGLIVMQGLSPGSFPNIQHLYKLYLTKFNFYLVSSQFLKRFAQTEK